MRFGRVRFFAPDKHRVIRTLKRRGCHWAVFGRDMLLWTDDTNYNSVGPEISRYTGRITQTGTIKPATQLYLVVQKGNLFQRMHPQYRIVFNYGRYLVVALTARERKKIKESKAAFGIEKLEPGQVVINRYEPRAREEARRAAWIETVVDSIDETEYTSVLAQLTSYYTRHSIRDEYDYAANWCKSQLMTLGYAVSEQTVAVSGTTSRNIIANKPGQGTGSKNLVIVCAHLDSINISGGSGAAAPGADDNGSGCAALLELARVLKDIVTVHDLRLVLFSGEEQGLNGSEQYVDALSAADRSRIDTVVNMDMIGVMNTTSATVLIEGAAVSQTVIDGMVAAAGDYTSLTVETSLTPYASDHVPFINNSLPAVLAIEGNDSANTHTHNSEDTMDRIDSALALEITRLCAGYIAGRIQKKGGVMPDFKMFQDIQHVIESADYMKDFYKYFFPPQWSGRYSFTSKLLSYQSVSTALLHELTIQKFSADTIYRFDRPLEALPVSKMYYLKPNLYINLHIDIDGNDPLQVVSGTIVKTRYPLITTARKHFIGQVTSNTPVAGSSGSRNLIVKNFTFDWPNTSTTIDRLEITLENIWNPRATVTSISSGSGVSYGPYELDRYSRYYRKVEIEVDKEDSAQEFEPFNTHLHPDRPADLGEQNLTMAKAYTQAGIYTRYSTNANTINTTAAGSDGWNYDELHDLMQDHWSAFANTPQWKMWFFAAESHEDSGLAGAMFDGNIDEPGGVDRQGTALFTSAHYLFDDDGAYSLANPPEAESVQRELFFTAVHEAGHAFNMYHPWQKELATPWTPPDWADPMDNDTQMITWMSYPEVADPSSGYAAQWFYDRFYYKFHESELLFLRHAPEKFVQMGNEDWGVNHGRANAANLDNRLELIVRSRRSNIEFGEPAFVELRLKNISKTPVSVKSTLDPKYGFVTIGITDPDGKKVPLLAPVHADIRGGIKELKPKEALYESINITIGKCGFHFKKSGAYRIEVCYTNLDGKQAAAQMQVWINPPVRAEDTRIIAELYNAKVASTLYFGGSRFLEETNDKIDWVCKKLQPNHPAQYYLNSCRALPFARRYKTITDRKKVKVVDQDPGIVMERLKPVINNLRQASDSLGHITCKKIVDTYTKAALKSRKKTIARQAKSEMLNLFKKRGVLDVVIFDMNKELKMMR